MEETLSVVLEAVQSTLDAERVVIFLPDASGQKLAPATGAGVESPADLASSPWLEEAGVAAYQAFLEGRAICEEGPTRRGGVAIPLLRLGEAVGAIFIQNPSGGKAFAEEDLHILAGLTAQAAVAISDARLYSDSEQWQTMMESLEDLPRDFGVSTSRKAHE